MKYPTISNISQSREMTTYFNGYNHTPSCPEGSFYDAKNISTEEYPVLIPRRKRGKLQTRLAVGLKSEPTDRTPVWLASIGDDFVIGNKYDFAIKTLDDYTDGEDWVNNKSLYEEQAEYYFNKMKNKPDNFNCIKMGVYKMISNGFMMNKGTIGEETDRNSVTIGNLFAGFHNCTASGIALDGEETPVGYFYVEGSLYESTEIKEQAESLFREGYTITLDPYGGQSGQLDKIKSVTDGAEFIVKSIYVGDNGIKLIVNGTLPSNTIELTGSAAGCHITRISPEKVRLRSSCDSKWCHTSCTLVNPSDITVGNCDALGNIITAQDESYYSSHTPSNGDYMISNGILKVYSGATKVWTSVSSTYIYITWSNSITMTNEFGQTMDSSEWKKMFKDGDGIIITGEVGSKLNGLIPSGEEKTFILKTFNASTDSYTIVIPGILSSVGTTTCSALKIERRMPEMEFIIECQNRVWGCSTDGTEIYCSKLGDPTNWYVYSGISTDSWAASLGNDEPFTGAINYLGSPIFFKEHSIIKVTVSGYGSHSYKEIKTDGVQKGSAKSLSIINDTLYYKSPTGVCRYDGNFPTFISDSLGWVRYSDAVGGSIDNRYYINMKNGDTGKYETLVYDIEKGLWAKEDDNKSILAYSVHDNKSLTFVENFDSLDIMCVDNAMEEKIAEVEGDIDWMAESGQIGFALPDHKYVDRISLRIELELNSYIDFYIQYDSSGRWIHFFNLQGRGTKTFTIPVHPSRCDHYRYMLKGHGKARVYSLTKTYEEGSDI